MYISRVTFMYLDFLAKVNEKYMTGMMRTRKQRASFKKPSEKSILKIVLQEVV